MSRRRRRRLRGGSRGKVPPELQKAYGAAARTLGDAVLSLLPPPPPPGTPCSACRGGAGCLACRRWGHLLRDGDRAAYRSLVTRAFCVVAPAGSAPPPPPPPYTPGNAEHSQTELVAETIRVMTVGDRSRMTANVLSSGCRPGGQCATELVSSSSWNILLNRIGDLLMCYILMHSSIFLPAKKNGFLQVTGFPLNIFFQNPMFASMAKNWQPKSTKGKNLCYLGHNPEMSQNISGGRVNNSKVAFPSLDTSIAKCTEPNCSVEGCNHLDNQNPRKRKRLYRWQRHNKPNQIYSEDKLFYEKSPSSVFDIRPSQCNGTSRIQSTSSQVGLPNFMHLNNGPICFNCLMLNSSKRVSVDWLVARHAIFFNKRTSYNVFHGNYILNKRKKPDALSLIIHIFGIKGCCAKLLKCDCHVSTTANSNCLCLSLPKLMNKLIRNSKRCQYKKLLLKHCSVNFKRAADVAKNHNGKENFLIGGKSAYDDQSYVQLEAYSTHQQVVSFIWAVLTRIIPEPLLGNSCSKRSLRINIWKFIKLRKFETFCLSDCIGELKVSHYSWISNIGLSDCFCSAPVEKETCLSNGSEEKLRNLLHCWISWMFSDIVIPLVQAYFYVTERQSRRYDVFYYPKTVWRDLTSTAIASLNKQNYTILRGASRKEVKQSCRSSRVRFVPKAKDMRPLVNLRAQSKDVLNKCHLVMKKTMDENPDKFGFSVFDYYNVHQNLWHFISSVRSQLRKKPKIYIVVADVSKAFDCITHDMLLKVVDDALKCDDYVLRKCRKVVCNRSKNAIFHFDSKFSISKGDNNVCDFSIQLPSRGGILVDKGEFCKIRKKEIQYFLNKQVKCNVLKIGQNFYSQQVGIIQGNKLSTNLCSLYFGHLENSELLKFVRDSRTDSEKDTPKSLLMRFIDDIIFISFSEAHALSFFDTIRRGFAKYNCYMNDNKYGFNFEVANSEHCCNRIYEAGDGFSFMPWSGLLINCETLEIQADYTRYLNILISSTLTVKTQSSTKDLEKKLHHYMRPKCNPIFFDSNINSPGTVRLNIYQTFLLCAMKFHCYLRSMPDASISKLELLHIVKGTFSYMHSLIARQMQEAKLQCDVRPVLKLRPEETMWLGLSAFLRALQKKQSRYKDLLVLLREEIRRCGHLDRHNAGLRYAVDDSHSSVFWKLKF